MKKALRRTVRKRRRIPKSPSTRNGKGSKRWLKESFRRLGRKGGRQTVSRSRRRRRIMTGAY